jgi:hypothetical protein
MKQKKNIAAMLIAAVAAITLLACEKEETVVNKTMLFTYQQTQCADAWQTGTTDVQTIQNLKDYLVAQGLETPFLNIILGNSTGTPPFNCTGCTCPTGRQFTISVLESDSLKRKYIDKGFVLKP